MRGKVAALSSDRTGPGGGEQDSERLLRAEGAGLPDQMTAARLIGSRCKTETATQFWLSAIQVR